MNGAIVGVWWARLAPREQRLVAGGIVVLLAAAVYALLWDPAAQGIRKLRADLPQLQAQDASMGAMADEAARLRAAGGNQAAIAPAERPSAVRRSLERAGLWRDASATGAARGATADDVAARGIVPTLTVGGPVAVASAPIARTSPPEVVAEGTDRVRVRFDDIDYGVWIAWLAAAEGELAAHAARVSVVALAPKAPVGHVRADVLLDWSQAAPGRPAASSSSSS